jgi:hypothetical protein
MKISINSYNQFAAQFSNMGRADNFSYEGLSVLYDFLEEIDPDYELDVIAICCDYTEDTVLGIARNYSIDLNDADQEADDYEEQCKTIVLEYLNEHTCVVGVTRSDDIVYQNF